jgi:hypothetical protein
MAYLKVPFWNVLGGTTEHNEPLIGTVDVPARIQTGQIRNSCYCLSQLVRPANQVVYN